MSDWAPKRFWTAARTEPAPGGHRVLLDARPIRTPAGAPLVVPTPELAAGIAREWDAQVEFVRPATMPMTRTANSAIDKVAPEHAAVVAILAEYGGTDLLSYRAERPQDLVALQSERWDPLLDWAEDRFGARLSVTQGVMPVAQDPEALDRLVAPVRAMSPFRLAAFHDLVALSGSLILGHAAAEGIRPPEDIWALSRLDEDWQAALWGHDEEAMRAAAVKRIAFGDAQKFFALSL
ncbi:ATP12 family chaperone protein [Palleronia rufa]|uniref:ATP12 family chaperone protein n=1 Tax=Palleronia rufa TaxID=1530186 RepID=UPI0005692E6E|nr:ATP12 family protein [Palleronia rufa]